MKKFLICLISVLVVVIGAFSFVEMDAAAPEKRTYAETYPIATSILVATPVATPIATPLSTTEMTTMTTKETTTTSEIFIEVGNKITDISTTEKIEEPIYFVYKPSTHYVHLSNCHWCTDECYEISNTSRLEVRLCSECNPDIPVEKEYNEPEITVTVAATEKKEEKETEVVTTYSGSIDSYSRQLLAEIVWHEAGSDWISQYNKAKVAAGVMNRVYDSRFPDTVYSVLTQKGQFSGYWPGCCTPTQACYDAVDYYFSHQSEFNSDNSWYGNGRENIFYYQ